jgi:UDP-N-acetylmuramate--alanine ligase
MVVEADESDGSFVKLPATIAVVTNIDPEHLDYYGSFDAVRAAFEAFVENIPFYGFVVLCIDHPEVQTLIGRISDRKIITYGFSAQADVRGMNVEPISGGMRFDAIFADRTGGEPSVIEGLSLPMLGAHNVQNALAAVALAREMGIDEQVLRRALGDFKGVKRRFTKVGDAGGITVIDDYAHHPVEIAAVLKAARAAFEGRIIAVVQPHRYSRLRDLFEDFCTCFNDADWVVVADVYAAGEEPIEGIDKNTLIEGLRNRGHRRVEALDSPEMLAGMVADGAKPGDVVIFLGAGTVTNWAYALAGDLESKLAAGGAGNRAART